MSHERRILTELVDDAVPPQWSQQLREKLKADAAWSQQLENHQAVKAHMLQDRNATDLRVQEAKDRVWERLNGTIEHQNLAQSKKQQVVEFPKPRRWTRIAAFATSAAALFAFGVISADLLNISSPVNDNGSFVASEPISGQVASFEDFAMAMDAPLDLLNRLQAQESGDQPTISFPIDRERVAILLQMLQSASVEEVTIQLPTDRDLAIGGESMFIPLVEQEQE